MTLSHLQRLEAESIQIIREVIAEAEKPVMLYSIGKDSSVMLHLARKAFFPAVPPFPLMHVDTTWKFRDMYAMRERMVAESGMELIVYKNPEAIEKGINPFTHGSAVHTDMWKTQGLKQALDKYGFDAAFGGARRDEEKSRAKERVFSFRTAQHRWDPKNQRPELWRLYNARKHRGESIRVFPLSNWTELDIWQYLYLEKVPIVPLYYARCAPWWSATARSSWSTTIACRCAGRKAHDEEGALPHPGLLPADRRGRIECRDAGGGHSRNRGARTSEREGRVIDHDAPSSMEAKKQEGYF
jgi:sulfate adenylyltransferase subunit 2